ncbi:hypothetical protein [Streptomyces graminilatus]|uniref:hypothetical protein n=1 Tax=Streptomyces graminilatus TaxID=1464070 RepID=UPI0006E2CA48|nr:hypothetical protein [Streptomyces graminilatus]
MLGFAVPTVLFLPGVAYLGLTNGHRFIDNAFFALMYGLFSTGLAAAPLLAWRRGNGQHADPGFGPSAWFPCLFTTMQGVAYSSHRGDASVVVLALGWVAFIGAGMVALYFLGNALWSTDNALLETGEAVASDEAARPALHEPQADIRA